MPRYSHEATGGSGSYFKRWPQRMTQEGKVRGEGKGDWANHFKTPSDIRDLGR